MSYAELQGDVAMRWGWMKSVRSSLGHLPLRVSWQQIDSALIRVGMLGKPGEYGRVYEAKLKNGLMKYTVALKDCSIQTLWDMLLELLGLLIANALIQYRVCPNFVLLARPFITIRLTGPHQGQHQLEDEEDEEEDEDAEDGGIRLLLVQERASLPLIDMVREGCFLHRPEQAMSIFTQILFACLALQFNANVVHHDLYIRNVVLDPVPKDAFIDYELTPGEVYRVPLHGTLAKLCDFGMATCNGMHERHKRHAPWPLRILLRWKHMTEYHRLSVYAHDIMSWVTSWLRESTPSKKHNVECIHADTCAMLQDALKHLWKNEQRLFNWTIADTLRFCRHIAAPYRQSKGIETSFKLLLSGTSPKLGDQLLTSVAQELDKWMRPLAIIESLPIPIVITDNRSHFPLYLDKDVISIVQKVAHELKTQTGYLLYIGCKGKDFAIVVGHDGKEDNTCIQWINGQRIGGSTQWSALGYHITWRAHRAMTYLLAFLPPPASEPQ